MRVEARPLAEARHSFKHLANAFRPGLTNENKE
jgi:hypothetical protein